MNRATPENIGEELSQALALIKEALDMSAPLFGTDQEAGAVMLWEAFIKEFIGYVRQRSAEKGINLMSRISITKILFS